MDCPVYQPHLDDAETFIRLAVGPGPSLLLHCSSDLAYKVRADEELGITLAEQLSQRYQLGDFNPPRCSHWGFGDCLRWLPPVNGWETLVVPLPVLLPQPPGLSEPDWGPARRLIGSLRWFLSWVQNYQPPEMPVDLNPNDFHRLQLLVIRDLGLGGAEPEEQLGRWGFTLFVTPALARLYAYLNGACSSSQSSDFVEQVRLQSAALVRHLAPHCPTDNVKLVFMDRYHFRVQVMGNASGLTPCDSVSSTAPYGYELLPDNIDSPLQQLTLLCVLAVAHNWLDRQLASMTL